MALVEEGVRHVLNLGEAVANENNLTRETLLVRLEEIEAASLQLLESVTAFETWSAAAAARCRLLAEDQIQQSRKLKR